jgi:hypothetical protein
VIANWVGDREDIQKSTHNNGKAKARPSNNGPQL